MDPKEWGIFKTETGNLWVRRDISADDVLIAQNAGFIYVLVPDEERLDMEEDEIMDLATERLNATTEEQAVDVTTRMIRLLISDLVTKGLVTPTYSTAEKGLAWLKDQCQALGILFPNKRELLAMNIVLNYVLEKPSDQYRFYTGLMRVTGVAAMLGKEVDAGMAETYRVMTGA